MPCYSVLLIQKNRKRGEFLAFIYCSKMQKCLSFRGLRPLDPHQGSALDPLGGLQRPQTSSCVQQWPTVIASCACGATPYPVSGNNWVITKYASQFFKAGYGAACCESTLMEIWAILPEWVFSTRASAWPMLAVDGEKLLSNEFHLRTIFELITLLLFCSRRRFIFDNRWQAKRSGVHLTL